MPFPNVLQMPIGNGSKLVLLKIEDISRDDLKDMEMVSGQWAHLVAYIRCETLPPSGDTQAVINHFAQALFSSLSELWWNNGYARLLSTAEGQQHAHVVFREVIDGQLKFSQRYLHSSAKGKQVLWKVVRYLEYGGVDENKPLHYKEADRYVVKTHMIARNQGCGTRNYQELNLQFSSELATKVGRRLIELCISRHFWGAFEKGLFDRLAPKMQLDSSEFKQGVAELMDQGYLAPDPQNHFECVLRERLIEKAWRASLRSQ